MKWCQAVEAAGDVMRCSVSPIYILSCSKSITCNLMLITGRDIMTCGSTMPGSQMVAADIRHHCQQIIYHCWKMVMFLTLVGLPKH